MWWANFMVRSQQRGLMLIELLVTIGLVAILAIAIVPLGRSWIATAHISRAETALVQSYKKAKVEALKNPNGISSDAVNPTAVSIVIDNTMKTIMVKNSNNITVWTDDFNRNVTISLATSCNGILKINNLTQVLNNSTPTTIDNTCSSYTITSAGGQTVTGVLR